MHDFGAVSDVEAGIRNIFIFWDGARPDRDRLDQINICISSVREHVASARIYIFSNCLFPLDIDSPGTHLIRWSTKELAAGTPILTGVPEPDGNWRCWSDIFRVLCLWRWGGSYLDVDDILVRAIPTERNIMAACCLSPEAERDWRPHRCISGDFLHRPSPSLAARYFRFGADPMLNFDAENRFLERWLEEIPGNSANAWGQELPTQLFGEAPDRWAKVICPIPWPDLLYHPYEEGHPPFDKRYTGDSIRSSELLEEREFRAKWSILLRHYSFCLVKNHEWRCHRNRAEIRSLLEWAVGTAWSELSPSDRGLRQS